MGLGGRIAAVGEGGRGGIGIYIDLVVDDDDDAVRLGWWWWRGRGGRVCSMRARWRAGQRRGRIFF